MSKRTFAAIAAVIFGIVALVHLLRIVMGWSVIIGTWEVPMWVSWVGFVVAGELGYYGTRFAWQG
jgi:hypothetical protein